METSVNTMLFFENGSAKFFQYPGALHIYRRNVAFWNVFRDMLDKMLNKFYDRNGSFHILVIFMTVIMESYVLSVVTVNAGSSNHRPPEVTTDVFRNDFRVTFVWLGVDIEALLR